MTRSPSTIPAELADQVAQYRTQLIDAVVETDEALMELYLETARRPLRIWRVR